MIVSGVMAKIKQSPIFNTHPSSEEFMASQMSINTAQFSDEHLDPLVAIS